MEGWNEAWQIAVGIEKAVQPVCGGRIGGMTVAVGIVGGVTRDGLTQSFGCMVHGAGPIAARLSKAGVVRET